VAGSRHAGPPRRVCGREPAKRDFAGDLERAGGKLASERVAMRGARVVAELSRCRACERGVLPAPGRVEDQRHLGEPAGPASAHLGRQLALDDTGDHRLPVLGLDLVGDDQPTLTRLQHLDRLGLDSLRLEEPSVQLGKIQ